MERLPLVWTDFGSGLRIVTVPCMMGWKVGNNTPGSNILRLHICIKGCKAEKWLWPAQRKHSGSLQFLLPLGTIQSHYHHNQSYMYRVPVAPSQLVSITSAFESCLVYKCTILTLDSSPNKPFIMYRVGNYKTREREERTDGGNREEGKCQGRVHILCPTCILSN